MELDKKIKQAYFNANGRNGSSRLAIYLLACGTMVSRTTVASHMKQMRLKWSMNESMSASKTVIPAICMANRNKAFTMDMIFHSVRGIQYACKQKANILKFFNVEQRMSRKGNCWENAVSESFFKSFKTELIYGTRLVTRDQMHLLVYDYIKS